MSTPTPPRPICFVVSPIGDDRSEIRERADVVLEIIERVTDRYGYHAVRGDKIAASGMITSQVIRYLFEAPLVIADLTGANPNVYYELALRHAAAKPYIQMIARGEKPRFDIAGLRSLEFEHTMPYRAEKALALYIEELQRPDFVVESPVTVVRQIS